MKRKSQLFGLFPAPARIGCQANFLPSSSDAYFPEGTPPLPLIHYNIYSPLAGKHLRPVTAQTSRRPPPINRDGLLIRLPLWNPP